MYNNIIRILFNYKYKYFIALSEKNIRDNKELRLLAFHPHANFLKSLGMYLVNIVFKIEMLNIYI